MPCPMPCGLGIGVIESQRLSLKAMTLDDQQYKDIVATMLCVPQQCKDLESTAKKVSLYHPGPHQNQRTKLIHGNNKPP